jgi:hypothetical protein
MCLKAPVQAADSSSMTPGSVGLTKARHRNGNRPRWRLSGSLGAMCWQVTKTLYHRVLQGFLNEYVLAVKGVAI